MNKSIFINSLLSQWGVAITGFTALSFGLFSPVNAAEFRSIDGSNNNTTNSSWGQVDENLLRLSAPAYENNMNDPRGGLEIEDRVLPSPRAISNAVSTQSVSIPNSKNVSDWVWQWGQFLDHDMDLSPIGTTEPFNIPVPTGDPFFDPDSMGGQTIGFNRSEFHTDGSGVRQQFNEITAYIDGSNVYGSDVTRSNTLRDNNGKLLAGTAANGEKLLMKNTSNLPNETGGDPNTQNFFLSGDVRANEQVGLLASHTLFMREHNRIADNLQQRLNNGEQALVDKLNAAIADTNNSVNNQGDFIFESARKVVGAQMQVITYNEWLPIILGENALATYTGYKNTVNAGISTEFSTAAFRFGHTMLSPNLLRVDNDGNVVNSISLKDSFFDPDEVVQNGINTILLGLASQQAQEVDTLLVDDVRNFLFGSPGMGGFDLASLNIQRGRDHGLADINTVRSALGLLPYTTFLELTGGDVALANAFETVYGSINEVDLWIAGLAEKAVNGGLLGQTFSTILIDQFTRSRDGDRFFYLNQLDHLTLLDPNIEDVTLSQIIRRNSDISNIRNNAFLAPSVPEPKTTVALLVLALFPLLGGFRCR